MKTKINFLILALLFVTTIGTAQQIQMPQASPSSKIIQKVGLTDVTVDFSRPSTKGRKIFGELVPYGQVWRTGANGATILTFSTEVIIGGTKVPAGAYALYSIPGKSAWTIILSKNTKLWGKTPNFGEQSDTTPKMTSFVFQQHLQKQADCMIPSKLASTN